jgi:large subunit ribosomal protein L21
MYAVIETGGKQYRVEVGTELQVELLDVEPGKTITLDRVLLVADGDSSSIGRPLVADAAVSAEVVRQIRGEKLISFKYRPKARSRVKKGHRQELTVLRISDITLDGKSAARTEKKAQDDAKTERERLEEAAIAQAAKDAELAAKLAAGAEAPLKAPARGKAAPAKAEGETKRTDTEAAPKTGSAKSAAKGTTTSARTDTSTKTEKGKTEPKAKAGATAKSGRSKAAATDASAKAEPKRSRSTKKDE